MTANLSVRYAAFAAVAIMVNLASQVLVFEVYSGGQALVWALAIGTAAGLVTKYLLDKNWIFFDSEIGWRAHRQKFALYTATGIVTTAIFWGTEAVSASLGHHPGLKCLGGLAGLSIGYFLKYRLDRAFVFPNGRTPSV
jgi:putative flippase GtrA